MCCGTCSWTRDWSQTPTLYRASFSRSHRVTFSSGRDPNSDKPLVAIPVTKLKKQLKDEDKPEPEVQSPIPPPGPPQLPPNFMSQFMFFYLVIRELVL